MHKIGRPERLIAYDTDVNIKRRRAGKPNVFRLIRSRTLLYVGVIAIVGGAMLYTLTTRSFVSLAAMHDRNPLYVHARRRLGAQCLYDSHRQSTPPRRIPMC